MFVFVCELLFSVVFRLAKRKLDNRSFFGSQLHVTYAPEQETVDDTRSKLQLRRQDVLKRIAGEWCCETF